MFRWNRPARMIAVRAGNPLSIGVCDGSRAYLGSLADGLPGKVLEVPDNSVVDFTSKGMVTRRFPREVQLEAF